MLDPCNLAPEPWAILEHRQGQDYTIRMIEVIDQTDTLCYVPVVIEHSLRHQHTVEVGVVHSGVFD